VRAVLDPNVIVSALLSRQGTPERLLRSWLSGAFDLVVSDKLLAELERALAYPKLGERIEREEAAELVDLLRRHGEMATDPADPPVICSADPDDDYLIALAERTLGPFSYRAIATCSTSGTSCRFARQPPFSRRSAPHECSIHDHQVREKSARCCKTTREDDKCRQTSAQVTDAFGALTRSCTPPCLSFTRQRSLGFETSSAHASAQVSTSRGVLRCRGRRMETGRHAGHADILPDQLDGRAGDPVALAVAVALVTRRGGPDCRLVG